MANLAAVLVVAVVAHLALMASPLHAAAMSPDNTAQFDAEGAMSMPPSATCMAGSGGCVTEGTTPASSWSPQSVISPRSTNGPCPLLEQLSSRALIPRAIGPPQASDLQVLLQVFRI